METFISSIMSIHTLQHTAHHPTLSSERTLNLSSFHLKLYYIYCVSLNTKAPLVSVRIPTRYEIFFSQNRPERSWGLPSLQFIWHRDYRSGVKRPGVILTSQLHRVPFIWFHGVGRNNLTSWFLQLECTQGHSHIHTHTHTHIYVYI